jgi:hypothetical protein
MVIVSRDVHKLLDCAEIALRDRGPMLTIEAHCTNVSSQTWWSEPEPIPRPASEGGRPRRRCRGVHTQQADVLRRGRIHLSPPLRRRKPAPVKGARLATNDRSAHPTVELVKSTLQRLRPRGRGSRVSRRHAGARSRPGVEDWRERRLFLSESVYAPPITLRQESLGSDRFMVNVEQSICGPRGVRRCRRDVAERPHTLDKSTVGAVVLYARLKSRGRGSKNTNSRQNASGRTDSVRPDRRGLPLAAIGKVTSASRTE